MSYDPESEVDKLCCQLEEAKDERDHLRTQLKSLEADAAVMREACQKGLSAIDKLMGDSDLDSDESDEMNACQLLSKSLSTSAGKSLLERLKVAEGLLVEVGAPADERDGYRYAIQWMEEDWLKRRDAFLNPTNKDK